MRPNPFDIAALIAIRLVLAMLLIVGFVFLLASVATRRHRWRVVSV
jgi:hypothetical protein